ncbi:hypothetical protein FRC09_003880, partial [Ceratobasidium sp. 395]
LAGSYPLSELGTAPQFTDDQIELLAKRAGKLFIYAATVVRYLRPIGARVNTKKRLEVILEAGQNSSSKAYESLDALYRTIVTEALENPELETWDVDNIKSVLHTVLCTRVPLSTESLAHLLGFESANEAEAGIECLRSVLYVSESQGLVSTLHASFSDFMLDAGRSRQLWCDEKSHHQTLARRCFITMEHELKFNICHLESSFVLDKDVPDLANRVDVIPPRLLYACAYWSEHMTSGSNEAELESALSGFLIQHALFWMEVMNLKKLISRSTIMLSEAIRWMKSMRMSHDECALCTDVLKFATIVAGNPVCGSTAHIYVSVLALWSRDSPTWIIYGVNLSNPVRIAGSAMKYRQSASLGQWKMGHEITSAAVSPDGRYIVSRTKSRAIRVWDTYTGALLAGPFVWSTAPIKLMTISRDGDCVAFGLIDNTTHVWDIHTGHTMHAPLPGYDGRLLSLVFSPDGKQIASGCSTGAIRIRDIATGQTVADLLPKKHRFGVEALSYSPDGKRLVSGSNDHTVWVWDAQVGRPILGPLTGHNKKLRVVAFLRDGSRIISMSDDSTVHIWDAQTGLILNAIEGYAPRVKPLACSPDGRTTVLGSDNNFTISIWDVETGQAVGNPYAGHPEEIAFIAYSPEGQCIISGSDDGTVYIWDAQIENARADAPPRHVVSPVNSVCFSSDGKRVAGGYGDGTIRIWDAYTGDLLIASSKVHSDGVRSLAYARDSSKIVSSSYKKILISSWDVSTCTEVGPIRGIRHVNSVAFSPSGRYIASAPSGGTIRIWDAETGDAVGKPFEGHTVEAFSIAYSPNGRCLVSGSADFTIRVWDVQTGQTMVGPLQGHTDYVSAVAFSPNGRRILSGSWDYTIRIWDAQTGHPVCEPFYGHTTSITSVAYSPDGTVIVSSAPDCSVRVWDAETGDTIALPFLIHTDVVESVSYSPDGSRFASGSKDGSIGVWPSSIRGADQSDPRNNWTMDEDGWIVTPDLSPLFWVPEDLRDNLNGPQNISTLRPGGWLSLDFKDAALGTKWAECFKR